LLAIDDILGTANLTCHQTYVYVCKNAPLMHSNPIHEKKTPFSGSETGIDSLHRFDPATALWEMLLLENGSSPPSRSGFGLTATRNGSRWTFWLFGGLADTADFFGKCASDTTYEAISVK
jgi:hypothetical protein